MEERWRLLGIAAKPNDCLGVELLRPGIPPGSSDPHQRGEGKESDPHLPRRDESNIK